MKFTRYYTVEDFLQRTLKYLEKDEAANNLMLGICLNIGTYTREESPYFGVVEENDSLRLAAVMTPPQKLIVYGEESSIEAFELLAKDLLSNSISIPGVLGPSENARGFADVWKRLAEVDMEMGMSLRIYRLDKVDYPVGVSGVMRMAGKGDTALVQKWICEFQRDAGFEVDEESAMRQAENKISSNQLFIWEDNGTPVSMAAKTRPTAHGTVISLVYTPPELRGRGYASACVAALSQNILDSGHDFCTLFTDLANPTSNSIYMKIGYKPICDFQEYLVKQG